MKTIIARFTELKENVAGTDESEFQDLDLNRVDTALKSVGVALKDTTGQFRNLDEVFMDLSSIWSTLDRNTQRYVATIAAGSRQQSRFLALMDGYERNVELMQIAADSTGQADKQFEKYRDTIEFGLNRLSTQWEKIRQGLLSKDTFNELIETGSSILDKIINMNLTPEKVALIVPFAAMMARSFIKTFSENLQNSGMQLSNTFTSLGKIASNAYAQKTGQTGNYSFANASIASRTARSKDVKEKQEQLRIEQELVNQERNRLNTATAIYRQNRHNLFLSQDEARNLQLLSNNEKQKVRLINNQIAGQRQIIQNIQKEVGIAKATNDPSAIAARQEIVNLEAKRAAILQTNKITEENISATKNKIVAQTTQTQVEQAAVAQAAKNTADQEQRAAEKAAELQNALNNIQASKFSQFLDKAGGIPTIFKGISVGAQQIGSTLGLVATMMLAGAEAVDIWNTALSMSVVQIIPQLLNELLSFTSYLTAANEAKRVAILETQALATAEEAEAAAKAEAAAAQAALTGGITLLISALVVGISLLGRYVAKQEELAKQQIYETSAVGKHKRALEKLDESLKETTADYDKASQELDDSIKSYEELTQTYEDYASKIALTEEEAQNFLTAQQSIAELHPELIAGYDEQGNAILAIGEAWDAVIKKEKEAIIEQGKQKALGGTVAAIVNAEQARIDYESYVGQRESLKYLRESLGINDFDWTSLDIEKVGSDFGRISDIGSGERFLQAIKNLGLSKAFDNSLASVMESFSTESKYIAELSDLAEAMRNELSEDNYNFDTSGLEDPQKFFKAVAKELEGTAGSTNTEFGEIIADIMQKIFTDGYADAERILKEQGYEKAKKETNEMLKEMVGYYAYESDLYLDAAPDQRSIIESYLTDSFNIDYTNLQKEYEKSGSTKKFEDWASEYLSLQFDNININKTLEKAGFNQIAFDILSNIQEEVGNSLVEQAKKLSKNPNISEDFYDAWIMSHDEAFQSRRNRAQALGQAMGQTFQVDEIGNITNATHQIIGGAPSQAIAIENYTDESAVVLFNEMLGEKAGIAFSDSYAKAVENNGKKGQEVAKNYSENVKKAIEDSIGTEEDKQGARDYAIAYDFSSVSTLNEENKRASFAKYLNSEYKIALDEGLALFDTLREETKKAAIYTEEELSNAQYGGVLDSISSVVDQMESHQKTLQKYAHRSGTNTVIDPSEWKEIQSIIDDLTDPQKGGLDSSLFTNILHVNGNQSIFEFKEFFKILGDNTDAIAEQIQNTTGLTEEQKAVLHQLISEAKMYRGEWMSIESLINGVSGLVSSFSSAASEQIKEGFLSSKSITSLLNSADEIGLSGEYIAKNFINDALQLDTDGLYKYIDAQIIELEKINNMSSANSEQIKIWQALKKELLISKEELEEEAEATDEAEKALDKYNEQLKTVEEKQKALNDTLKEFNDFLYGDENRSSGLDKLYNYQKQLEHYNDEIARSKDLLSDAETIDEATSALQRYSAATHNSILYEKARQEAIRRGLAEQEAQLNSFIYSYNNPEGGAAVNIKFSDYIKKEPTGLYSLDQTLLDRARFNDDFKTLLEQQVDEYNKYAEELLKSEDNVRKMEKEFQEQRAAAVKQYATLEKNIADALKNNYQEEVENLKEKYDSMKEADDDYLDALTDAIEKQRKLRERESKYTDLAKKEKKLSLISRDTSGAQELQRRQLEQEIEKDRQTLLDEAIDDVIEEMKALYEQQEENRAVEMELKDALIENTNYWNSQAEDFMASFETAEDYMAFMADLDKDFAESTLAMREDQLNTWREEYQGAIQYNAIQAMDATSETGDFIVDTINITGDEIARTVAETTDAYASEVVNAYNETTQAFQENMEKQIDSINKARDALAEAIKKLQEYAEEVQKITSSSSTVPNEIASTDVVDPKVDWVPREISAPTGGDNGGTVPSHIIEDLIEDNEANKVARILDMLGLRGSLRFEDKASLISYLEQHENDIIQMGKVATAIRKMNPNIDQHFLDNATSKVLYEKFLDEVKAYRTGGLVNYTGPAWVDGTRTAPEAFLNPEDTKRIGEAARILSDLPFFNSYGEAENISNISGDISVEINLNIDKISSETDIDEMLNRVKEEIVSTARSIGTNTILQQ